MTRRVLIVDDEFGLADILAELLRERGYEVALAINGQAGLAALAESRPHLVVLDVMMPVLDGPEMLRRMRADPRYQVVPVVFMTALPESVPQESPPLHQAVLQKPFGFDELLAVMERLLEEPA